MESPDAAVSLIGNRLRQSAEITEAMSARAPDIARAAALITKSFQAGGKLLLCGNGGSAADCQHLAAEFINRLSKDRERRALPALALTTDTSCLTAYANDYGFEGVYARQIEAFGAAGDVLLAISTSGSSPNVLAAADAARRRGIAVIALLGESGRLAAAADVAIKVPSQDTQLIQQVHLAVEHLICELVERALFE
jgi:phosphoheptose isomerase